MGSKAQAFDDPVTFVAEGRVNLAYSALYGVPVIEDFSGYYDPTLVEKALLVKRPTSGSPVEVHENIAAAMNYLTLSNPIGRILAGATEPVDFNAEQKSSLVFYLRAKIAMLVGAPYKEIRSWKDDYVVWQRTLQAWSSRNISLDKSPWSEWDVPEYNRVSGVLINDQYRTEMATYMLLDDRKSLGDRLTDNESLARLIDNHFSDVPIEFWYILAINEKVQDLTKFEGNFKKSEVLLRDLEKLLANFSKSEAQALNKIFTLHALETGFCFSVVKILSTLFSSSNVEILFPKLLATYSPAAYEAYKGLPKKETNAFFHELFTCGPRQYADDSVLDRLTDRTVLALKDPQYYIDRQVLDVLMADAEEADDDVAPQARYMANVIHVFAHSEPAYVKAATNKLNESVAVNLEAVTYSD